MDYKDAYLAEFGRPPKIRGDNDNYTVFPLRGGEETGNILSLSPFFLFLLIRYIEANAHRAKLTKKAQDWKYGSLHERVAKKDKVIL